MEKLQAVKIGTEKKKITVTSEVDVVMTFKGYAPVVRCRVEGDENEQMLYISAKSLANNLEKMRKGNGDHFLGLEFYLSKESNEKLAQYVGDQINPPQG